MSDKSLEIVNFISLNLLLGNQLLTTMPNNGTEDEYLYGL